MGSLVVRKRGFTRRQQTSVTSVTVRAYDLNADGQNSTLVASFVNEWAPINTIRWTYDDIFDQDFRSWFEGLSFQSGKFGGRELFGKAIDALNTTQMSLYMNAGQTTVYLDLFVDVEGRVYAG